ncbi:MAG: hypothetical protein ABI763_06940 [Bacteroidota bacterium]
MTSFLAIAENSKFEFISFRSNAVGVVDKMEGKFQVLVKLRSGRLL